MKLTQAIGLSGVVCCLTLLIASMIMGCGNDQPQQTNAYRRVWDYYGRTEQKFPGAEIKSIPNMIRDYSSCFYIVKDTNGNIWVASYYYGEATNLVFHADR